MAQDVRISPRQRAILTAVVESFIATGEPVASKSILSSGVASIANLSSATIRNEMAALDDAGLLEQPHSSAGRVPTARAFRYFVEQITGRAESNPQISPQISDESRLQIDNSFTGISTASEFLERTSHVLALMTRGVGVALVSATHRDLLEHVHFSRLSEGRVLAVVVTRSGMVRDRVLVLDRDFALSELEAAAHFLNEFFQGWNIEDIRAEITRRAEMERSEYVRLMNSVDVLWQKTMVPSESTVQNVWVGGVANLAAHGQDPDHLHRLMQALEEKQHLVELLNAYVDARQDSVRVIFNLEEHAPEMRDLVLIAAPARVGGESHGAVGIIGPTRMQYENNMNAVSYIASLFDRMLHSIQ
jgi:heat-inducible transcriptional repressor